MSETTIAALADDRPSLWSRTQAYLSQPIPIQSLAVTRILFGAILLWDCYRYFKYDRIYRYYVEPTWNFPYFGLDFIRPLPEPWIYWAWALTGVFAFMVMIGAFYRFAIVAFTVVFGYFFLLDKTQYLNHNYMVLLYAILLCFAPAARAFSVDAWRRPETRMAFIPRWPVSAIRLQTEIILIYAGIVKITDDWLRGEPLGMWLRARADEVVLGPLFQYDWVILAGTWGVVALHILGAPLLLWRRTRLAVFLIYVTFHVSNSILFNIGIFPWLTIAVTLIFFDPDWPQKLARRALGLFQDVPPIPAPTAAELRVPTLGTPLMVMLAVWFAVQIAVPQRQVFFPNLVGWTGDGHRFSWRMRIYNRSADGVFVVRVPETGEEFRVDPYDVMSGRQARAVLTRTDLIHDFAARLEDSARADGLGDVEVRAEIFKGLNGRPRQLYIDPTVDLTSVPYNWFRPDPWVLPLATRAGVSDDLPDWLPPWPQQRPWEDVPDPQPLMEVEVSRASM